MKAKFVFENIESVEFKRGLNPKKALGIGMTPLKWMQNILDSIPKINLLEKRYLIEHEEYEIEAGIIEGKIIIGKKEGWIFRYYPESYSKDDDEKEWLLMPDSFEEEFWFKSPEELKNALLSKIKEKHLNKFNYEKLF